MNSKGGAHLTQILNVDDDTERSKHVVKAEAFAYVVE